MSCRISALLCLSLLLATDAQGQGSSATTPRPQLNATDDPLLRVGTIIFNSKGDDASALPTSYVDATGAVRPAAPVTVTWRVQNNMYFDGGNQPRASIVRLDYITRQVQTVQIGVRLYDLQSGQPQQMTLTQKFRIRNLKR